MLGNLTGWHLVIILAIVLLLFGATKLPALAKSVGQSARVFKGEMRAMDDEAATAGRIPSHRRRDSGRIRSATTPGPTQSSSPRTAGGDEMFGLTMDKLVLILVIGVFLLGPKRLPVAAAGLARIVKTLRGMADQAQGRLKEELGPEFAEVDWASLDPRKYDPRRIIADALMEPPAPPRRRPV